MVVLSATDLSKVYGTDVIIEKVSFHVNEGDRIGIVGANGAGKSTLLNILTGEMNTDSGSFFLAKDRRLGYLKQKDDFNPDGTVIEAVSGIFSRFYQMEDEMHALSDEIAKASEEGRDAAAELLERFDRIRIEYERAGGYSYKSEMRGILSSMSFGQEYMDKPVHTLSGGERTRLSLACLLMEKPDILLLDEPTNHLDISTLRWLEQYLSSYKGTVIIVSHDRYFLDQVAKRIFEVENHHLTCYEGNYTYYAEKKRADRAAQLKAYNNQQAEIRRQEDMIRRYKERGTEKLAKRAASREKRLAHLERLEKPDSLPGKMRLNFHEKYESGKDVVYGENLGKTFGFGEGAKRLFKNVSFDIKKGERICIVGPNGVGKTTLLRMLMEEVKPTEGYLRIGHNVDFGYYDQGQQLLNPDLTVMDQVHNDYRLYTDGEIRGILGRFLFKDDQVFIRTGDLSGGEKARLSLLKLMMCGSNTLILDEPTNHLDIASKEVFEEALLDFPGTVIAVSHDRYFLNRIPTRILELTPSGMVEYLGKWDYYVEKKEERSGSAKASVAGSAGQSSCGEKAGNPPKPGEAPMQNQNLSSAEERALKKQKEAEERRAQREKEKLEKLISETEAEISEKEALMCRPETLADHKKLSELDAQVRALKTKLDEAYEKWMEM